MNYAIKLIDGTVLRTDDYLFHNIGVGNAVRVLCENGTYLINTSHIVWVREL